MVKVRPLIQFTTQEQNKESGTQSQTHTYTHTGRAVGQKNRERGVNRQRLIQTQAENENYNGEEGIKSDEKMVQRNDY